MKKKDAKKKKKKEKEELKVAEREELAEAAVLEQARALVAEEKAKKELAEKRASDEAEESADVAAAAVKTARAGGSVAAVAAKVTEARASARKRASRSAASPGSSASKTGVRARLLGRVDESLLDDVDTLSVSDGDDELAKDKYDLQVQEYLDSVPKLDDAELRRELYAEFGRTVTIVGGKAGGKARRLGRRMLLELYAALDRMSVGEYDDAYAAYEVNAGVWDEWQRKAAEKESLARMDAWDEERESGDEGSEDPAEESDTDSSSEELSSSEGDEAREDEATEELESAAARKLRGVGKAKSATTARATAARAKKEKAAALKLKVQRAAAREAKASKKAAKRKRSSAPAAIDLAKVPDGKPKPKRGRPVAGKKKKVTKRKLVSAADGDTEGEGTDAGAAHRRGGRRRSMVKPFVPALNVQP